jgi:hypothetical protein
MSRKVALAIILFLAAASAWAQSPAPAPAPAPAPEAPPPVLVPGTNGTSGVISRFGRGRVVRGPEAQLAPRERLQEMEGTLTSMHALLKDMQAKNASSRLKDPVAKANLEMWELLLVHLDKEFHQLQAATATRQELEARRASLYNQAYEKAAKEAQAATGATAGQTPPAPSTPAPPRPNQPKE